MLQSTTLCLGRCYKLERFALYLSSNGRFGDAVASPFLLIVALMYEAFLTFFLLKDVVLQLPRRVSRSPLHVRALAGVHIQSTTVVRVTLRDIQPQQRTQPRRSLYFLPPLWYLDKPPLGTRKIDHVRIALLRLTMGSLARYTVHRAGLFLVLVRPLMGKPGLGLVGTCLQRSPVRVSEIFK